MVLGLTSRTGASYLLDCGRARANVLAIGAVRVAQTFIALVHHFSFFSLSLGDGLI